MILCLLYGVHILVLNKMSSFLKLNFMMTFLKFNIELCTFSIPSFQSMIFLLIPPDFPVNALSPLFLFFFHFTHIQHRSVLFCSSIFSYPIQFFILFSIIISIIISIFKS